MTYTPSYWTNEARKRGMMQRMTAGRSGLTNPGGLEYTRIRYVEEIPDDGTGKLKPGDRWCHWQIYRYTREGQMWLTKIEKPDGGGSPCYTWMMDKERGLRFGSMKEAALAAEKAKGHINRVIRKYRGTECAE